MILIALLRLLACLPLAMLHRLGRFFGILIYLWPGKYRRHLRANAAQAGYPENRFARRAAAEIGAMIFEMPKVWFQPERCLKRVYNADPPLDDVVAQAQAEKQGIIFLTPHLGCFEILARYLACQMPLTVMFRPPRARALAPVLERARNTSRLRAVPADIRGVREFVRALRSGGNIGMLPDQAPKNGEGVWAPFFGRMAYTVTLPGKLATPRNTPIIIVVAERLPRGRGWRTHYVRIPGPLPADPQAQATLINATMENVIRRFPHQYLWSYNRYKIRRNTPAVPSAFSDTVS